jgi:recombination DNA repair RAD52 pathway protein
VAALDVRRNGERTLEQSMSGRRHPLMRCQRVTLDLDHDVATLLAACAADAHVSEGEFVERAVRAMDLRALVARIRKRSDLDEDESMPLAREELRAVRAEHAA